MTQPFQPTDPRRFEAAIRRFDEENAQDPNREVADGQPRPRELVYAERLTAWVLKLCPNASEELRLAARAQHLRRWTIPRQSYPATRAGYLQWRQELKRYHARCASEILAELGYPEPVISLVKALNLKQNLSDPETAVLEDALCLVFLQFQFAELAAKSTDEKMVNALQKSWKKMTPAAQAEALRLEYGPREKALVDRALGSPR